MIESKASSIGGDVQFLQGGGNLRIGIATCFQIRPQQRRFDLAIVLSVVPGTEVTVAEAIRAGFVGEQGDDAVLRFSLGASKLRVET